MRYGRLILKLLKRDEKKSASEYNAPAREPIQVEAQMKKVKASEESGTSFRRKDIRCQSIHLKNEVDISNISDQQDPTSFGFLPYILLISAFHLYWLSNSVFPFSSSFSRYGDTRPNLHFFQYIQAIKPHINPVPLNSKPYQIILTHYHQVPSSTAPY